MKRHHTLAPGPICYCVPGGASSCATCREQRALKYPMIEYGLGYSIAPLKREGQSYDPDPGGMVDEKGIRVLGPKKTFMAGGDRLLPLNEASLDRLKAYIDAMYSDMPACNTGLSKAFREFWSTEDAADGIALNSMAHPVPAGHITLDCPEDFSEESLIPAADPEGSGEHLWAWFLRGAK